MRFVLPCESFPLLLLIFAEKPPREPCRRRQEVAALIATDSYCLLSNTSDVAVTVKSEFAGDLNIAASNGTCPLELHIFIAALRAKISEQRIASA